MILLEIQKSTWHPSQDLPDQPKVVGLPGWRCACRARPTASWWVKPNFWKRLVSTGDPVRDGGLRRRPEEQNKRLDSRPAPLLMTCETTRDHRVGALMCPPVSRKHPSMDCVLSGTDGLPELGCRHLSPTIRLSALFDAPAKIMLVWNLAVNHLLCKTNKLRRRHYFARPLERQSHEKGNVNQCIAAGRMPDCDC